MTVGGGPPEKGWKRDRTVVVPRPGTDSLRRRSVPPTPRRALVPDEVFQQFRGTGH